ncbi:MAG TPA: ATP-binding protein [Micromonosporaceae bacterium]
MTERAPLTTARWSLTRRITALFTAVALLLAGLAVVATVTATTNSRQVDMIFNDISFLKTDSQNLLVAMLNQETGVRGYALDGAPAALAPYANGLTQQKSLVADMTAHLDGRKQIASDLALVQSRVDAWHTGVAAPTIAKVQAGDHVGAQAFLNRQGTGQFDAIRTAIATLQTDVQHIRDVAVAALKRTTHEIVEELAAAAVIVLIAGLLLAWLLRRLVTRPVRELAATVRIVAAGDFNHQIDLTGPPEVAALGRDVDEMRRRIVDDLRVVERANESVAQANAQLQQHAAELVRSNEDLEQFAYVASHDLQEPLRKVASFCQLLQRRYAGQLDERADQYISFAVDGAHRMQRLINDLLEFSRIGRTSRSLVEVDLSALVASIADTFKLPVSASGGAITRTDLPTVVGEPELLSALMMNLISNGVKFRREGEPIRVSVTGRQVGDDWQITVADNGIGIEREYADRVFVIFQRLHSRDIYPGTGIGLAIAKRIVEYHGGRIWVDSTVPGDGTTFRFTLPMTHVATDPGLAAASPALAAEAGTDPAPVSVPPAPAEPIGEDVAAATPNGDQPADVNQPA